MLGHNKLTFVLGTHYSKNGNKHKMADISHRIQGPVGGWNLGLAWKQGSKCCQDSFSAFSTISLIILLSS